MTLDVHLTLVTLVTRKEGMDKKIETPSWQGFMGTLKPKEKGFIPSFQK